MNIFYWSRRINYFAGILNLINTFFWFLCGVIIASYHFLKLKGEYSGLNNSVATAGTQLPRYAGYPATHVLSFGYADFFKLELIPGMGSTWTFLLPIFVVTLVSFLVKFVFTSFSLFAGFWCRDIDLICYSIINMFIPIFGYVCAARMRPNLPVSHWVFRRFFSLRFKLFTLLFGEKVISLVKVN